MNIIAIIGAYLVGVATTILVIGVGMLLRNRRWNERGMKVGTPRIRPQFTVDYSEYEDRLEERKKMNIIDYIQKQQEFSLKTFGPGSRTKGIINHIQKELKEIEENPNDLLEWIDVIILALDGAWRTGYSSLAIVDALEKKLIINQSRKWPDWETRTEEEAIEHYK